MSPRRDRSMNCRLFLGLAALLVSGLTPVTQAAAQSTWEFDPYRIQLLLAVAPQPELDDPFAAQLLDDLSRRVDAYLGAAWELRGQKAEGPLASRMMHALDEITREDLSEVSRCDKVMLLAVRRESQTYLLRYREFDVLTEHWQTPLTREVATTRLLADETLRGLLAAFAPLGEIETVEDKVAQIRWRAAALPPRDPGLNFVPAGTVLQPFLRLMDREGKTRKIQPIDWTFLISRDEGGEQATATIYTGLRSPLARKRRGRVQQLALAVRGASGATRLVLRARTDDARSLSGYEVYAYGPDSPATVLLGNTDRSGTISIPPGPGTLRLLVVKNGAELLARLPIVPGLQPELTARLADDAPRLAAEAFLLGLQERLIDVVVRRQVLAARIKLRVQEGKFDDAARLMDQLRRLEGQQQFLLALDSQQRKQVSHDALVQRKIDRMFADARKLVGQYLDPREVNQIEIDLDSARRAQADRP